MVSRGARGSADDEHCGPSAAAVAADLRAAYKARTAAIPACGAPAGIDATVFVSAPGDGASLDGGDGVPAPAIGIDALWATASAPP